MLTIELYRDAAGQHRWHMKRSGRIIATSGEGYRRGAAMRRTLRNLMKAMSLGDYDFRPAPPVHRTPPRPTGQAGQALAVVPVFVEGEEI